jgi:hypothetical protein
MEKGWRWMIGDEGLERGLKDVDERVMAKQSTHF